MKAYLLDTIKDEAETADARFGTFRSSHEGLGVLLEEFAELQDAVRLNDAAAIAREAVHVAAVALRIAEAMENGETRARSGCK